MRDEIPPKPNLYRQITCDTGNPEKSGNAFFSAKVCRLIEEKCHGNQEANDYLVQLHNNMVRNFKYTPGAMQVLFNFIENLSLPGNPGPLSHSCRPNKNAHGNNDDDSSHGGAILVQG